MPYRAAHISPLTGSHFALIANAASGNKDTRADIALIEARIRPQVAAFSLIEITPRRSPVLAAKEALASGATLVAVLGGDGTQNAVAGVLSGQAAVMAVLPGGTFNYFSRGLGEGESLEEALNRLETGEAELRDLAELNGHIFLNNASFGIYPDILDRREKIYRRWGRSRLMAWWSVLLSLTRIRAPMRVTLRSEGLSREMVTPLIFAARSPCQVESFGLEGAEAIRDGAFALLIARSGRRRDLALAALRLAFGQPARGKDFEMIITDDAVIDAGRATRLVALDGEKRRISGPWHLRMRTKALQVIVAAGSQTGEAAELAADRNRDLTAEPALAAQGLDMAPAGADPSDSVRKGAAA